MNDSLYIFKNRLVCEGTKEHVGNRYNFIFSGERVFALDMDEASSVKFEPIMGNIGAIKNKPDLYGRWVGDTFTTNNEKNVYTIETSYQLREMVEKAIKISSANEELRKFFPRFASEVKYLLDYLGIFYEEKYVNAEELYVAFRFLGGYKEWSSNMGLIDDICDADILSYRVRSKLDLVIKELDKKLPKSVRAEYRIGEKAWVYFKFSVIER